ncbi:hypothetical protein MJG53_011501 [Ovis ammon polii x Ovis aries]|uniref:Uncharacterized protein n=1 Tax=Ovis ammon polii x Ovis aries TaxID=2918886 RepID=A0ACB9UND4_9CETA|nr:hypothetical protein MJG53_011501 [Ovis ammon polii x Ovis aries]
MTAYKLVLIRHGESTWNLENRFSGWYDADLSPAGHEEAKRGRQALRDAGYEFDICFTSVQKRAIQTLWTVLDAIDQIGCQCLQGIVKHLEGLSEEAIMELNLPTGIPMVYELDKNLKPIKPMQFLGDEETVRKAMEAVAAQGKAKK